MEFEGSTNTEDEWPVIGEVPGGIFPVMLHHNGDKPATPEELERVTSELNGGCSLETASKRPGVLKVLTRDNRGWVVLVGTAGALGTAVGLFELGKKILENRRKTNR